MIIWNLRHIKSFPEIYNEKRLQVTYRISSPYNNLFFEGHNIITTLKPHRFNHLYNTVHLIYVSILYESVCPVLKRLVINEAKMKGKHKNCPCGRLNKETIAKIISEMSSDLPYLSLRSTHSVYLHSGDDFRKQLALEIVWDRKANSVEHHLAGCNISDSGYQFVKIPVL